MEFFDLASEFSAVRVSGANRLDFVQRMSTGDVASLAPGQTRATVFTTPIGRMIDRVVVVARADDALMLCGPNPRKLVAWLRRFIFFNDDVQLEIAGENFGVRGAFGDGATEFLREQTSPGVIVVGAPTAMRGAYFLGPPGQLPILPFAGLSDYHARRIGAGVPHSPAEICEDYNPLEAGLLGSVSFSKGCYIGQEIIARMESRGQLAKKLVALRAEAAAPGDEVWADGALVGKITSAAVGTLPDARANALAYVRTPVADVGQFVAVGASRAPAVIVLHGGDA